MALAMGAAVVLTGSPAWADDEDDARDACEEIAKNRNWKDIDTDIEDEGDRRIRVRVSGERDGEDRQRECVYDKEDKRARMDDQ
jgi:hypothetical protein